MRNQINLKHRIIGITGKMHSGKTTVTNFLMDQLTMSDFYPTVMKFAQPLYDMQKEVYRIAQLDAPKTKDRKLLQFLGTDWGRDKDPDLWINLWRKKVRTYMLANTPQNRRVVLCDDLRFDNEAKQIKDMGGVIINVEASDEVRKARAPESFSGVTHASENGIDPGLIDLTIYNISEMFDLRQNIRYLLSDGLI
jgi:uridine kinase